MGSKSSTQDQPDYTGAAEKQAQSSKEVTNIQNWANRPNQFTPWGSTTWNSNEAIDPATGQSVTQWTQQQQLRPELESALQSQVGLQNYRSDLGRQFSGRVAEDFSKPYDWTNLPGMATGPGVQDYGAQRQRIESELFNKMAPIHQSQESQLRTRLANQGLTQGSEAFEGELGRLRESQAGERYNALQTAGAEQQRLFGMDTQAAQFANQVRQQAISEQSQQRNMSLNELNALLTGQQVQSPSMPGFQPAQASQATQYLDAAKAQGSYNLEASKQAADSGNSMWGGIGQAVGTGAMLFAMSDARLKTNIKRIGTYAPGVGVYSYEIFGRPEIGVMAQELMTVRPDLVAVHDSGYLMVNYGGL